MDRDPVRRRTPPAARALLVAVLAGPLPAQVYVPDANAASGPASSVPLGAKGPLGSMQHLRTQIRVPASSLPAGGSTITELSLAGVSDGTYSYGLLEVRLAHLASGSFGTTFAANLAGEVVVLQRTATRLTMQADEWSPLGLSGTFRHDGARDLVVDIVVQSAVYSGNVPGSRRSSTLETIFAPGYDVANPAPAGAGPFLSGAKLCLGTGSGGVVVVGSGCPKANGQPVAASWSGTATLGGTLRIEASGALAGTTLQLLVGTDDRAFGPWTLPFDLAPLGAPGCLLRTDVVLALPATADGTGQAAVAVAVPANPTLRGQPVLFQWLAPEPAANALGAVVSGMVKATLQ